jgi:hypothetical protein
MNTNLLSAVVAAASLTAIASSASAAVVLSDNFNSDAQMLNWPGDSVFTSLPVPAVPGQSSTDLIGTGFFDFYPGNGNYVDLDGTTGSGNNPAGILQSNASFGAGSYTLTFDLGGNARGAPSQTTVVTLGSTTVASLTLPSSSPYQLYSFTFTTTGGNLVFTEQGPSNQQGNILDNVTLSSVPEPASWALMMIGIGAVGSSLRRRAVRIV